MCRNTPLLPVCRQRINPSKTITGVLLFTVALLALSSCGQSSQGNAPKPTVTLTTPPTSVGSPITPTTTSPLNSLKSIHMIDATTGWALTNTNVLYTTIGWALGYTPEAANTLLFKTTDGGQTWTQIPLATT